MPINIYAILGYDIDATKLSELLNTLSKEFNSVFESIRRDDLVAIITLVDEMDIKYNQNDLLQYATIIERLFEYHTLIPFRFGSMVKSFDDINDLLKNKYDIILRLLKKLKDKDEYSFRIMYSKGDNTNFSIDNEEIDIYKIPDILTGESLNKNYLKIKYKKYFIEKKRSEYAESVKNNISYKLGIISDAIQIFENRNSLIIIDAVLLIDRNMKTELISIVSSFKNEYNQHNIILTGPWPPYNFSKL